MTDQNEHDRKHPADAQAEAKRLAELVRIARNVADPRRALGRIFCCRGPTPSRPALRARETADSTEPPEGTSQKASRVRAPNPGGREHRAGWA